MNNKLDLNEFLLLIFPVTVAQFALIKYLPAWQAALITGLWTTLALSFAMGEEGF